MSTITPQIASLFADTAYRIKKPGRAGYHIGRNAKQLGHYFDFNLSDGLIKGVTGGFLSHLFNKNTGFALLGQGKGTYKGDHVVAITALKTTLVAQQLV